MRFLSKSYTPKSGFNGLVMFVLLTLAVDKASYAGVVDACADPAPISFPPEASHLARFNANTELNDRTNRSCGLAVEDYCSSKLSPVIAKKDLEALFTEITKQNQIRMSNPRAACASRAKFVQKWLADQGYKSQILIIQAPAIVGVFENSAYIYADHVVPAVQLDDLTTYVLDPQFMDAPMEVEDYLRAVTGGDCELNQTPPTRVTHSHCVYFRSVSLPSGRSDAATLRSNPKLACRWDLSKAFEAQANQPLERPILHDEDRTKARSRAFKEGLSKSRIVLEDAIEYWIQAGDEISDKQSLFYKYTELEKAKAETDLEDFNKYRLKLRSRNPDIDAD